MRRSWTVASFNALNKGTHTPSRGFPSRSILSVKRRHVSLSLCLSLSRRSTKHEGTKRKAEREEEVKERERQRKTWQIENVRFDVIVCMSGFPIYSQFDWQEGRAKRGV